MIYRAGCVLFALLLLTTAPSETNAQAASDASAKSIWSGVYTEAQATRGEQVVQRNCASCHLSTEWSHSSFLDNRVNQPVRELHAFISAAMPLDAPGKLTSQEYSDIVAYMLKLSRVPAGSTELPNQGDSLRRIQITRRDAR
jgi:cytochrome c